jgi:hypothetical protein
MDDNQDKQPTDTIWFILFILFVARCFLYFIILCLFLSDNISTAPRTTLNRYNNSKFVYFAVFFFIYFVVVIYCSFRFYLT